MIFLMIQDPFIYNQQPSVYCCSVGFGKIENKYV